MEAFWPNIGPRLDVGLEETEVEKTEVEETAGEEAKGMVAEGTVAEEVAAGTAEVVELLLEEQAGAC